jgi:AAA domain, putative AbiEii toxin, Type IV TA system
LGVCFKHAPAKGEGQQMVRDAAVKITSVRFLNFKAFEDFSVSLQAMNILVGPNNCGKSTIIGAFRALEAGIRSARAKNAEWINHADRSRYGYRIPADSLPISIENVHTDYAETETQVTFRLSNLNRLQLYFPQDGGCILFPISERTGVSTPGIFKREFPISMVIVPVLGPVEHDETLLKIETVQKGLATHRASRHFRNYWYHFSEDFYRFSLLIKKTWPRMEIQPPEILDRRESKLTMFCLENRITREIFWAGFGFQIWCQLLTHIARAQTSSLLIVDEPEIYLHPDVQRQLIGILRDAGPDVLLATHSTEMMGEADPAEIMLIDKTKKSGERLRDIDGVQAALDQIGSLQNITLTKIARYRKVIYVEDINDFGIILRFAHKIGKQALSSGTELTPVKSGGFASWKQVIALAREIKKALGRPIHIGAIYDRDYYCSEEVAEILQEMVKHLDFAHIHDRKEIENYLLVPNVLERTIDKLVRERSQRNNASTVQVESIASILERLTTPLRDKAQARYIANRIKFLKNTKLAGETITEQAIDIFNQKWKNIHSRLEIVRNTVNIWGTMCLATLNTIQ